MRRSDDNHWLKGYYAFGPMSQTPDSLPIAPNSKIKLVQLPFDSTTKIAVQKADSVRDSFKSGIDSLQRDYQATFSKIETQRSSLQRKIDSLQMLKLPTRKLTRKLDSLNRASAKKLGDFTKKVSQLKTKATSGLKEINLPPQLQEPMQKLTQSIEGYKLPGFDAKVPSFNIPGIELPKLGDVNLSELKGVGDIGNLNKLTEEIKMPDVGNVTEQLDEVKDLTGQVGEYSKEIKDVKGQINQANALDKAAEAQVMKLDEVKDLQKNAGMFTQMTGSLSEEGMKAKAKEMAMQEAMKSITPAMDHFAGKEVQLQQAMNKLSKYKSKYANVKDLATLPKRAPNPMKDKPFIERLVPGITFQIQKSNYFLLDVNPVVRYKFTGRFTAGAGWNERLAFDGWNLTGNVRVYGPRAVAEYKWGKGFFFSLSPELMNTTVPSQFQQNPEDSGRQWVFGAFAGLKKEFRVFKSLMGNTEVFYNLINTHGKSPYGDRFSLRFGFEFPLKRIRRLDAFKAS